jgi:hypothetical protein
MHIWQSKAVLKTGNAYNSRAVKANRPKGIKDEDWAEILSELRMNKLIILDKVPKASRKGDRGAQQEKE